VDGRIIVAIQLGGAPIGSLALSDRGLSDTVLNSIVNLAAIGLERARADEATARAEAARSSSELRAIVLDALAHDFKTPLTSMKGASSDLLVRLAADPSNHELVSIIDDGVDRLGALVTDAVQMIRIDAGRFAVHRERHRLLPIVAGVVNQFERRLDGHAFVQQVPPELHVDADKHLLELALRQLIDNAVKYSPSTAAITIAAHENGAVNIAVHNSDSAIPDVEQSRVFERFYRGTHAAHIPGTGMGLAIVQRIAQAHGGGVRVESDRRNGTTFTLTLPRGAAA
jgi:two-component system sensor histidine kinase KdpD